MCMRLNRSIPHVGLLMVELRQCLAALSSATLYDECENPPPIVHSVLLAFQCFFQVLLNMEGIKHDSSADRGQCVMVRRGFPCPYL